MIYIFPVCSAFSLSLFFFSFLIQIKTIFAKNVLMHWMNNRIDTKNKKKKVFLNCASANCFQYPAKYC